MTKIATIILNYNGKDDLLECLESVARVETSGWDHHVVVVDNASADGSVEAVRACWPGVHVLENGANLGFADGNNRGIAWARERGMDYIILLNNDTTVEPDTFSLLLAEIERRPGAGAVMPLIKFYGSDDVWYAGGRWLGAVGRMQPQTRTASLEPYRTQLFTACCVLVPMRVLDRLGDLDSRFFIYYEDAELALRMDRAGLEVWVVPRAQMYHKVSRSHGGPASPFVTYYQIRNNLLLIREMSPQRLLRGVGYAYVSALSAKMMANLFIHRISQRRAVVRALGRAWTDFALQRWGARW